MRIGHDASSPKVESRCHRSRSLKRFQAGGSGGVQRVLARTVDGNSVGLTSILDPAHFSNTVFDDTAYTEADKLSVCQ